MNVSELELSEFMFANALQMAAQFNKKREITEAGTLSVLYKEFSSLSQEKQEENIKQIKINIIAGRYKESVSNNCKLFYI